jgi:hypothetical protein
MIGAILLKRWMEKNHAKLVSAMDPSFAADWAEDVVVTPMGCPPIRGRDAFMAFERCYFDTMASYQVTTHSVSVARPWALGLTNTLVVEDEMRIERKDGQIQTLYEVLVVELKRGKVVAVRTYLADPDAENVTLGVE